jgi:ATP-dependent DNA ligase
VNGRGEEIFQRGDMGLEGLVSKRADRPYRAGWLFPVSTAETN